MTTFHNAVNEAKKACEACGVPTETVMTYLVEIANVERYNLYMNYDEEMPEDLYATFTAGMNRILKHEPMAHVLGYSWFYGYKFTVNEDVLIPRYETEELVSYILSRKDEIFPNQEVDCIDVGTGSGAIAISLKKEEPSLKMVASDISEEALVVARKNALDNDADIEFIQGDMLQPFIDRNMKVDMLISNPPYIPNREVLEDSVVDFEPHVALFGGLDGMDMYRTIFKNCKKLLKEKSFMAFEIGHDQFETLNKEIATTLPDARVEIIQDMSGKNRMLFVYFNC